MAINFPDSPTNGQVVTVGGKNYTYNSTKNTWTPTQVTEADLSTVGSTTVVATHDLLPASPSAGDMALVSSVNKMYVYFLSGWWLMSSLQNASPSGITGNAAIYDLAADGTPTTVTLSSSDPEGFPIVWSHSVISGSLGGTTVTNVNNVFTITPSTDAADAGTFTLRFAASDGQGGESGSQSQFTLEFVFIVTNSRYTTLLATATGTSDNNNITDASTNNHSITVNGDARAGTFSPYRSRGYSTYFEDTAANVLYASPSSDFAFGTGAFTISVWVKLLHQWLGTIFDTNDGSNPGVMMSVNNTTFYTYSNTWLSSTSTSSQDVWQHFCWTRDGSGNNKVFVNGTQATTFTDSTNYTSQNFKMGEEQNGTNDLKAYIKDLHIVKGYAYEPDSTYADGAAEPTTGTVFLGCGLPYHGDKSSSPKTLTIANSGISIVNDTPHDYNEYDAADHGGSVYFDGSGDSLNTTATQIIPSTSFTVTAWVYLNDTTNGAVWGQGTSGHSGRTGITIDNNKWFAQIGSANLGTSTSVSANRWYYTDFQWDGSTLKFFVDGTLLGSVSNSNSPTNSAFYIGDLGSAWSTGYPLNGHVSDLKIVSGTPSGSSTVPTSPLSSSGAALHIKGTDASIIDKSQGANLKLVGNTTGSTTLVKFSNTKSMYFDGTGDDIRFDTISLEGDFTLEYWLKLSTYNADVGIFGDTGAANSQQRINHNGTFGKIMLYDAGYVHQTSNCFTQSEAEDWMHIAYSRQNGSFKLYVNGVQKESITSSKVINVNILGAGGYLGGNDHLNGYIQDFRITKGLARYTANFTPPTASLEG